MHHVMAAICSALVLGTSFGGCGGVIRDHSEELVQPNASGDPADLRLPGDASAWVDAGRADAPSTAPAMDAAVADAAMTHDASITQPSITTGDVRYDRYDNSIAAAAAKYRFPDSMIVKSMMLHESNFDPTVVSPDAPCGVPTGWTNGESRSFGLLQMTPACVRWFAKLSNGRPNLTQDATSTSWPTSAFNPTYNIDSAVRALAEFILPELKKNHPGCTHAQYMMMTVGAYNSGNLSITGCGAWNERAGRYVTFIRNYYQMLAGLADIPFPY